MNKHPILFSTPMIQAILDGRKTMTRRIIKPQPKDHNHLAYTEAEWKNEKSEYVTSHSLNDNQWFCKYCGEGVCHSGESLYKCPYGKIGDILWVRETWCENSFYALYSNDKYFYKATEKYVPSDIKWKPSIFMPKEACRIKLQIINIKVERVQSISWEDAEKEGCFGYRPIQYEPTQEYKDLWYKINGEKSWWANPWVWVVEFKKL